MIQLIHIGMQDVYLFLLHILLIEWDNLLLVMVDKLQDCKWLLNFMELLVQLLKQNY